MEPTITASVGEGCINNSTDVATIDGLLRRVGMLEPEGFFDPIKNLFRRAGLVDDAEGPKKRIAAIKRFQEIWGIRDKSGQPDGKIMPNGLTLGKLNQTATPLAMNKIEHDKDKGKKIKKGGYMISFTPAPPPKPYQVWLGVSPAPGDYIDITGCKPSDVMTAKHLGALLMLIDKHHKWGYRLDLRIFVTLGGNVITTSISSQPLQCPVYPHNGRLLPLDQTNNGEALFYPQNPKTKAYEGRLLEKVEGFDRYLFGYYYKGGSCTIETDPTKRGFDCITYAGAVCDSPETKRAATSTFIAWCEEKMAATSCTCEKKVPASKGKPAETTTITLDNAPLADIKAYFRTNAAGYHVMWSGNHVVLVADGTVHEFHGGAFRPKGYSATPVETWLSDEGRTSKQSVRKLGVKPPRCG